MSLNAATIEILLAKGFSGQDILDVARATEVKADRTNAERQARHRRKRNAVTVTDDAPKESNIQTHSSEPEGSKESKPARSKSVFVLPDWVPPEPWEAFETMRKAMRGVPFGDAAKRGIISDLEKLRAEGHDVGKCLLKSVKLGWRGVFGGDDTKGANGHSKRPLTAQELRSAIAFAEDNQDIERVAELKRQLAALREKPPDPKVAQLVRGMTERMRATH